MPLNVVKLLGFSVVFLVIFGEIENHVSSPNRWDKRTSPRSPFSGRNPSFSGRPDRSPSPTRGDPFASPRRKNGGDGPLRIGVTLNQGIFKCRWTWGKMTSDAMAEEKFKKFMVDFNKNYGSTDEKWKRLKIFQTNLEIIDQWNREQGTKRDGSPNKAFGITEFADLTQEEFAEKYLMKPGRINEGFNIEKLKDLVKVEESETDEGEADKSKSNGRNSPRKARSRENTKAKWSFKKPESDDQGLAPRMVGSSSGSSSGPPPSYFSWSDESYYPPVQHQGNCGACSEMSLQSVLAILYSKRKGASKPLSTQQLLDCVENNSCEVGATYQMLLETYMLKDGVFLAQERDYPYRAVTQECLHRNVRLRGIVKVLQMVHSRSENEIINNVRRTPFVVSLVGQYLQFYTGPDVIVNCPNDERPTHGGALVGYGIHDDVPYYLIRNSWGSNYGIKNGHVMIKRGTCCTHLCTLGFQIRTKTAADVS
ncbi:unnamed protein product [Bemisia tabaci]|uniref:Uncharacterized protein n=1 Tax=Bemisia tabaci TaxID=7038 RepID=A0A9P0A4B8_BEMTA|nr:unnamed protein product [Bemisia tabaci]